jgi:hypothetical protein
MLASLFGQFADFVAACHGKPYQWRIGGADTAIQWLISPIIPKIYKEMSNQAGISMAGKQHQKAVKIFFRTGRTEALKTDLLNSRIHFCVLRKGVIAEKLLKFDADGVPKKPGVRLKAEILGEFDYKIYVKQTVLEAAKAKATKKNSRFWDELPFTMVGHNRVHLEGKGECALEDLFENAGLNIQLGCETAIQAVNMLEFGYAAVLASYFPKWQRPDLVDFGLDEFQITVPSQTLILVSPASLWDYNPTARSMFALLKTELQARLKA